MSKTYIAHLQERYIEKRPDGEEWLQMPVNVSGYELTIRTVIPLTPYTEPDPDAIRNEAYNEAYRDAVVKIGSDEQAIAEKSYQSGLNDAWDAARKIVLSREDGGLFGYEERKAVFGCGNYMALKTFLAPEAIEKIRQYEQEKEERITKGDVVRIKSAPEIEIFVTYADGEYVGGIALTEMDDSCKIGDRFTDIAIHKVEKTGRHYEIAEVLKKMQEEKE